jgi:D-alanyl-D-alanine carboxypeptidase
MEKARNPHHLLVFMIIVISLEAVMFSAGNFKLNIKYISEIERVKKIKTMLENTEVKAKALSVYNITQNKKIYGKNDDEALPLASLAKIMTVIVALDSNRNILSSDNIVSISKNASNQEGDYGLFVNERWNIYDLARLTLINSANDGAYALWENNPDNFLEKMNTKAHKLGMDHASFLNITGLDIDGVTAGGLASASDVNAMAIFAERAYPDIFSATLASEINLTSVSGFTHNFKNTDIVVNKIPNLLFSKTGFTDVAGGNLIVMFKDKSGEEIAVTVMGSTYDGRFDDMEKIVNVLYNS